MLVGLSHVHVCAHTSVRVLTCKGWTGFHDLEREGERERERGERERERERERESQLVTYAELYQTH